MGASMTLHQNIETVTTFQLQLFSLYFFSSMVARRGQKAPPMVDDYLDRASLSSTVLATIAQIQNTKYKIQSTKYSAMQY